MIPHHAVRPLTAIESIFVSEGSERALPGLKVQQVGEDYSEENILEGGWRHGVLEMSGMRV